MIQAFNPEYARQKGRHNLLRGAHTFWDEPDIQRNECIRQRAMTSQDLVLILVNYLKWKRQAK